MDKTKMEVTLEGIREDTWLKVSADLKPQMGEGGVCGVITPSPADPVPTCRPANFYAAFQNA